MTEVYEYDDDDDVDTDDDKPQRTDAEWATLRREKKAREKAEKELADMKKQVAFTKAGIDPDDPKARYFVKGYDGDMTAEAIRAEAVKAGFISETPEPEPDQSGVKAQERISAAGAGQAVEALDLSTAALDQAFAEGGTEGMMSYLASQGLPVQGSQ